MACYKTNSERKLLIHKDFYLCFFCGHFDKRLDFQGFDSGDDNISTKLSTRNMHARQSSYKSGT
jgi:hypothetical protein